MTLPAAVSLTSGGTCGPNWNIGCEGSIDMM